MTPTSPHSRSERGRTARRQAREKKRFGARGWRTNILAVGAAATLGFGLIAGGTGVGLAAADEAPAMEMTPEMILGLLDDDMVTGFVEMCRTGLLANGNPNAGESTDWDPNDVQQGQVPPGAIATCTDSTGTGLALVLPETFEIGGFAQNMWMDLGPDQNILGLVKFEMGERNLFNIIGGLLFDAPKVAGLVSVRDQAKSQYGISIDPRMFDAFETYDEVVAAAKLPVKPATEDRCVNHFGRDIGKPAFLVGCSLSGSTRVNKGQDLNAIRRNQAISVAEYLTGATYPRGGPIELPAEVPQPKGKSTIIGDGINIALSMRGGTALAETGNSLAVALAGADHGQLSTAYAKYGIAIAANMDTEDLRFTWFGQDVDFSKLLAAGLLDSDMAAEAGAADMTPMLEMIGGLNGTIPSLKEVYCLGLDARATAEGLGSCTNVLGTFDTYKDLRPLSNGSQDFTGDSVSRQQQWGLTDISSLALGNDALLQQFLPLLGGEEADLGALLSNPTVAKMLGAVLSEDHRLKLTKDFIRYTKNVETVFAKEPVLDDDGNPVMVTRQVQATDAAGNLLWNDDEQTDPTMVEVSEPLLRNKTTPRMVPVTESVWEDYTSDVPVLVDDLDDAGDPIYVDADGNVVDAGTEGATKRQVGKLDDDGNPVFQTKTRHLVKPVMIEKLDDEGNRVLDANGEPVLVQKTEQATDAKGNLLWDPVVESTVTAHWLTSDYGLREPLTIEWLGHQVVFFPAVEVNGTYRPNLIGLPQIKRITSQAHGGLLPKISLVQWDNAFGLGSWSFDNPWDLPGTVRNFLDSVTLPSDLKAIDGALGLSAGVRDGINDGLGDLRDLLNPGGTAPEDGTAPEESEPEPELDLEVPDVVTSDEATAPEPAATTPPTATPPTAKVPASPEPDTASDLPVTSEDDAPALSLE